jgi:hypothetical protein
MTDPPKVPRPRKLATQIGPYTAAVLVLVPLMIVEPLKLVAVWVAGEGQWFTGTVVLLLAYAGSFFVVERLFRWLKPNILRAPALARLWIRFVKLRRSGYRHLRQLTGPSIHVFASLRAGRGAPSSGAERPPTAKPRQLPRVDRA